MNTVLDGSGVCKINRLYFSNGCSAELIKNENSQVVRTCNNRQNMVKSLCKFFEIH